tara:strand:+ start:57 stop:314 length:258 start_codon:yes stop_codon:yes gene_type:complete
VIHCAKHLPTNGNFCLSKAAVFGRQRGRCKSRHGAQTVSSQAVLQAHAAQDLMQLHNFSQQSADSPVIHPSRQKNKRSIAKSWIK